MNESTEFLLEVEEVLHNYRRELYKLCDDAWLVFQECYRTIGCNYPEDFFGDIKDKIESMGTFCNIKAKLEALKRARASCSSEYCLHAHLSTNPGLSDNWNGFKNKIQEIIEWTEVSVDTLLDKSQNAYTTIRECPYGEQKNKNRNASLFEKKVLEFFDWLFISELERVNLREIETSRLRRDGVYKVLDEFDTLERCGFQFKEILVECKNFAELKYPSLMQVFVYTLTCQDSEISKVPLSLLISRKNPNINSTIWRIRRGIFNKPMKNETRLILFLDDCDLGQMLKNKQNGNDPASVLRKKIEELARSNIKHGGI
jgi:hypothetical protein